MIQRLPFRVGLPCVIIGIVVWAALALVVTPETRAAENGDPFTEDQLHLWAHELRQAAIVLTVGGLALMLLRFPWAFATVVILSSMLFAVDLFLDARDFAGVGTAVSVAAGTGLVVLIAFGATISSSLLDIAARRGAITVIAIATAYCAPAVFANAIWPVNTESIPLSLYAAAVLISAGLAAVAGSCAFLASYSQRDSKYKALTVVVVPALTIVLAGMPFATVWCLPSAAAIALIARRQIGAGRRVVWRRAAVMIGSFLLAVPAAFFTLAIASAVGEKLTSLAGYEQPVDGVVFLPGALFIGLVLGFIVSRLKYVLPDDPSSDPEKHNELDEIVHKRPDATSTMVHAGTI